MQNESNNGALGIVFVEGLAYRGASRISVLSLNRRGPAARCGCIAPGDWIVSIDSVDVTDCNLPQVSKLIAGPVGSQVTLEFERPGTNGQKQTLVLVREKMGGSSSDGSGIKNQDVVVHNNNNNNNKNINNEKFDLLFMDDDKELLRAENSRLRVSLDQLEMQLKSCLAEKSQLLMVLENEVNSKRMVTADDRMATLEVREKLEMQVHARQQSEEQLQIEKTLRVDTEFRLQSSLERESQNIQYRQQLESELEVCRNALDYIKQDYEKMKSVVSSLRDDNEKMISNCKRAAEECEHWRLTSMKLDEEMRTRAEMYERELWSLRQNSSSSSSSSSRYGVTRMSNHIQALEEERRKLLAELDADSHLLEELANGLVQQQAQSHFSLASAMKTVQGRRVALLASRDRLQQQQVRI